MNLRHDNGDTPALYVERLTFNNGTSIAVNHDDIVVFVGPNNAGKSQSLKDIVSLLGKNANNGIVISDIDACMVNSGNALDWLQGFAIRKTESGSPRYSTLGCNIYEYVIQNGNFIWPYRTEFWNLFVNELSTDFRLSIVQPTSSIDDSEPSNHPIHEISRKPELRKQLSGYFHRAFGEHLTPSFNERNISLHIGAPVKLEGEYADEQDRQDAYKQKLIAMPRLNDQGDGMRSFAGILLHLIMPNYSCFLIDEPESFLHPPQAKILGQIISEILPAHKQAFISTHSQDFLKGLLQKCPERVKIIRVTREGETNGIKLLDNEKINRLWNDSIIRYSNIIDSLFHETTVVCESDSDCLMYSIVLDYLKAQAGKPNSTLFTYCSGKQRLPLMVDALKSLGVKFRIIPDLDVLNDKALVQKIVANSEGDWAVFEKPFNAVDSAVRSLDWPLTLKEQKEKIDEVLKKIETQMDAYIAAGMRKGKEMGKRQLDELRNAISSIKGWDMVKHAGISAMPKGEAVKAFKTLDSELRNLNIIVPEIGELENFVPEVGNHGPAWVSSVLETYPDLSNPVYDKIKTFVSSWDKA